MDTNGAGKTSLLSAIYILLTSSSFPQTKIKESVKEKSDYFGIRSRKLAAFMSGQLSPTSRWKLTYDRGLILELLNYQVFTYIPNDNQWFFLARTKRLEILDNLLGEVFGLEFIKWLKKLQKSVQSKNSYIKKLNLDQNSQPDFTLVDILNQNIIECSNIIWEFRKNFFDKICSHLPEFNLWINSSVGNMELIWQVSDIHGSKYQYLGQIHNIDSLRTLFNKEQNAGKCLFGAQRDEFDFSVKGQLISTYLSRGEMRLFILFFKKVARNMVRGSVIWLLDDIFNEFDNEREKYILEDVFNGDYLIATGTKVPDFKDSLIIKSLEELKI